MESDYTAYDYAYVTETYTGKTHAHTHTREREREKKKKKNRQIKRYLGLPAVLRIPFSKIVSIFICGALGFRCQMPGPAMVETGPKPFDRVA